MPAVVCTVCCAAAGGNNLFVGAGQLFRPTINTQAGTSSPAGRGILKHNTRAPRRTSAKFHNHREGPISHFPFLKALTSVFSI